MRRPLRFLPFFLWFAISAAAQSRIDCNVIKSRILGDTVHFCVLLPPSYDSAPAKHYPVLYFLHGLGENEQTLFKTGGWNLIEDLRQQHRMSDFLIVTPEARTSFYVNSADGKVRYSDFFLQEFIPYIEGKYRIRRERKSRAITGISMGGYGALRFAFAHPEMFSAVSAQSAALMTESPPELNAAMRSGTRLGNLLGPVFGNPIDVRHWKENDPLALVRKNKTAIGRLAIYLNCGRDDEYDFEVGATALDKLLQDEHIKHEFHLYPGNHSASYFGAHIGEVMEFHSKIFGTEK
ncbi:MAG TPA: alpha/beta hydrolase family protein [Terriglobales bacterium]|nr:alpha/beta hydrolase family protein [Terriglobales bacterium]